jgi:hypothetical protein
MEGENVRTAVWWVLVITYILNIPGVVYLIGRPRTPYTPATAIGGMCISCLFIAALMVIQP